jgi:hypothetical protein
MRPRALGAKARRRERERVKEDAARQKERERRQQIIDKAQSTLDAAGRKHEEKAADIQAELEVIEERLNMARP